MGNYQNETKNRDKTKQPDYGSISNSHHVSHWSVMLSPQTEDAITPREIKLYFQFSAKAMPINPNGLINY